MATNNNSATTATAESTSSSANEVVVNVNDYDQPVVQPVQPTTPQEITVCVTIRNPV